MVVLVTGAAKGLGLEVARQLAAGGATVILTARDAGRAREVAAGLDGDVRGLALDVTDDASVQSAAAAVDSLDVLVNNAAAYVDWTEVASAAELDAAARVMDVNLYGAWRVTRAFLPRLRESGHPRVVNVSSGAGSHADEQFGLTRRGGGAASYGISKAALNALTSTLAAELADTPILINAVCPGLSATFPGAEQMGARPVADGAASIVWAATLPDDGPSGGLYRDGKPLGW
jgi:NAD(P)-dependent dehydrogenase (short-subunit alcohol dehydrogenase family)